MSVWPMYPMYMDSVAREDDAPTVVAFGLVIGDKFYGYAKGDGWRHPLRVLRLERAGTRRWKDSA